MEACKTGLAAEDIRYYIKIEDDGGERGELYRRIYSHVRYCPDCRDLIDFYREMMLKQIEKTK